MSDQGQYPEGRPGPEQGPTPPPAYPPPSAPYPSQPPYGYGYPSIGYYGAGPAPGERPGKLTAAAVITWIGAGLVLAVSLMMLLGGLLISDETFRTELERRAHGDLTVSYRELRGWLVALSMIGLLWSGAACVLAGVMLRRQNWARITLAVLAGATVVVSLLAFAAIVPILLAGAAVAVLVLLFNAEVNVWFRGQDHGYPPYQQQTYPPAGPPPGSGSW